MAKFCLITETQEDKIDKNIVAWVTLGLEKYDVIEFLRRCSKKKFDKNVFGLFSHGLKEFTDTLRVKVEKEVPLDVKIAEFEVFETDFVY